MRCPNCGIEIGNGLQACPACGQGLLAGADPDAGPYKELIGQELGVPSPASWVSPSVRDLHPASPASPQGSDPVHGASGPSTLPSSWQSAPPLYLPSFSLTTSDPSHPSSEGQSSFGSPVPTSQGYGSSQLYPQGYVPAPGWGPPFSYGSSGYYGVPPLSMPTPGTYAPAPGAYAAPSRKRQPWLVVGFVSLIALLLVAEGGITHFLYQQAGSRSGSSASTGGTSPSGGTVILSDPLTSNVNGWSEDSHCHFGTGGYHLVGNVTCFAPVGDLTDATVQVQAELLQGSTDDSYGIALRRVSRNSEYYFSVSGHGHWSFAQAVNGTITYLVNWTANAAVLGGLNRLNLLKVTMQGSHFTFYINGVQVGSASDTTYANGLVGLSSSGNGTAGNPSDVVFTHLLITTAAS